LSQINERIPNCADNARIENKGKRRRAVETQSGPKNSMIEISSHHRGGQGIVAAAYHCASAAFKAERCCQAFPIFGAEPRGAPAGAFARISDETATGMAVDVRGRLLPSGPLPKLQGIVASNDF
jgi:hypothetical protein